MLIILAISASYLWPRWRKSKLLRSVHQIQDKVDAVVRDKADAILDDDPNALEALDDQMASTGQDAAAVSEMIGDLKTEIDTLKKGG
ncbi:MAG: hypothetical protein FWE32_02580 [Oscillospiraceae bacterium]|nr:hypothetical protein [Oscillospiraceae bacterium]